MNLRVATYNVHKCRGMDRRVSTARIAEVLREIRPDIAALQEVTGSQAEALSGELGAPYLIGENRRHLGEPYGNAVFSRIPVRHWRNYDLSIAGRERRGCLRVDFDLGPGGAVLHLFNVHLGTGFGERRYQGRMLVAEELLADLELQHPRILLGDFNEWTRGLTTRLLRGHMKSADYRWRSYPGFLPVLHLDHIYYDDSLRLDRFLVHRSRRALIASDHLPLIGEFQTAGELAVQKGNGSK